MKPKQKKLLICGSRYASPHLLNITVAIVKQVIYKNIPIICGDAPGIDAKVIKTCNDLFYPNLTVYGIKGKHRHHSRHGKNKSVYGSYTKRDVIMVNRAFKVVCIWDGKSKGTKRNYDHAITAKKQAKLIKEPSKQAKCLVANIRKFGSRLPSNVIYIGRPRGIPSREHWGNPFTHYKGINKASIRVDTRDDAYNYFEKWLLNKLAFNTDWQNLLRIEDSRRLWILHQIPIIAKRIITTNKDIILASYFYPKSCHGNILAKLINDFVDYAKYGFPESCMCCGEGTAVVINDLNTEVAVCVGCFRCYSVMAGCSKNERQVLIYSGKSPRLP